MKKAMLMLMLLLVSCTLLSGCQKAAESTDDSATDTAQNSPFNTSENGAWGDESNFIRITDLTGRTDELLVDDFSGGSFTLSDEREYAIAVYLHNTSDETQDIVITLTYADVLRADEENLLDVLLGWGGEDAGFISDTLELAPTTDLALWPTDNDGGASMAIIRHSDGELTKTPLIGASLDGSTTQMITLDEVPSGEYCIIFFMFESLPATE